MVDVPVVQSYRFSRAGVEETLVLPRGAEVDSHGLAVQQTMVSPQLQFLYEVIDFPGMQLVQARRCVQRQVSSTAAVHHQGRHLPLRGAEAISHGLTVHADHRDSLIAVCVVDVPVALSCISLVVAQRQIHMVQTARGP